MKFSIQWIVVVFFAMLAFSSCSDSADDLVVDQEKDCELVDELLTIVPLCAFDPTILTDVQFPVQVWVDGERASLEDYTFDYSSDADFGGSAISVSYDQLPMTVTLTDIATDCTASATLDTTFWD